MDINNSAEKPIFDVCLKHKHFIEKFVGGSECYFYDDSSSNSYQGHAYSYIEDQFDPESMEYLKRFSNISNQTFIYLAEGPKNCWSYEDGSSSVVSEVVFLTCRGIHIICGNDDEINVPWTEISAIEADGCTWRIYKKAQGKREEIASFALTTLVGGSQNTNIKKWRAVFSDFLNAARTISTTADGTGCITKIISSNKSTCSMNIDKTKIDYVIGIDLGHGETSAALCPIQWDLPVGQLDPVKDLELGGNKKVIPSAITIMDNGNAYIGDSAFSPDILKNAQVHVCFKKKPEDINGDAEQLMIRFMSEVYKRIRDNNSALLTDTNHLVYIATPSGWDKDSQNLYFEMAKAAGIPIGGITKESRAAFVRAQNDVTSGLGRNIEKGAIVFDMGSSTLDFTYMNKDLPNLIDNGYDCGASQVEKTIFRSQEEESDAIKMFESKYPKLVDYLVFEARKVKEQVYFDPTLKVKKTINFDDFIEDDELEDERFKLVFNPGELDSLLDTTGYLKSIEDAMLDYKKNFIPNQKIYGVFLTGGASRMDFIKSLVCKCWNVDESQVYRDNDPSLTISQGVAEVARIDLRTDGMDTGLEEEINKVQNSDAIYDSFIEEYGGHLFETVRDRVAECINAFHDDDEDWTLYGLQEVISKNVKDVIAEESETASEYMDYAVAETIQPITDKVEDIIRNYSSQGINVNINDLKIVAPKVDDINLDGVMDEISNNIIEESTKWGGVIAGAAIGGVIGVLFPIIGILGGAAILAKKIFFGETETDEEKQDKAMSRLLNKESRDKVYDSLAENWGVMQDSIRSSINNALTSDTKIKESINQAVRKLLNSYKSNLKSARVLID
ncbi:MAG: hypothetical protein ACI3ZG_02805 [Candidatus Coprenecus sp.]